MPSLASLPKAAGPSDATKNAASSVSSCSTCQTWRSISEKSLYASASRLPQPSAGGAHGAAILRPDRAPLQLSGERLTAHPPTDTHKSRRSCALVLQSIPLCSILQQVCSEISS